MWPFKKSEPPQLTSEAYHRWLRAQRPPFVMFFRLGEAEQETLAMIGEDYTQDCYVAMAYAMRNPAAVALMAEGTEEEIDAAVAAQAAAQILGAPQSPPPPTMGGITERRAQAVHGRRVANDEGRMLFGKAPDLIEAP